MAGTGDIVMNRADVRQHPYHQGLSGKTEIKQVITYLLMIVIRTGKAKMPCNESLKIGDSLGGEMDG